MAVKNMVIFFEDMYKFEGKVYTETTFKETHPLLFSSISAAVDIPNRTILSNPLVDKLTNMYSHIVEARLEDNKIIGDSEMFADKYKVIEKDIYYGYAITAHKSQGSTFQHVIGDEGDFQKLFNRWNFSKNCLESRIKEKNQLRYVMCTRPKQRLFIAMGNECTK